MAFARTKEEDHEIGVFTREEVQEGQEEVRSFSYELAHLNVKAGFCIFFAKLRDVVTCIF